MKMVRGILLGTYDEQVANGDPNPIDPRLIRIDEHQEVPVDINYDATRRVGKTTRVWRENGRILFEAVLFQSAEGADAAALAYRLEMKDAMGKTIKGGDLLAVGLMDHEEPGSWSLEDKK